VRTAESAPRRAKSGQAVGIGQPRQRRLADLEPGVEERGALGRIDVLRELDLAHRLEPERPHRRAQAIERVDGCLQQLPGRAHVADLMAVLAEEAEAMAAHVNARAHPVALLG
jgi:hypothetical protein